MMFRQIPDPFGPVTQDDLLFCAAPAALPGLHVEPLAKLFGGLDGTGVGGGIGIADGEALLVPGGLGEDASQLDLTCMGWLAFRLALPTDGFFLHHRNS